MSPSVWIPLVILMFTTALGGYLAAGRIIFSWSKQTLEWSKQTFEKHERILEQIEGSISKLLVLGAENRKMIENLGQETGKMWARISDIDRRTGPVDRRQSGD